MLCKLITRYNFMLQNKYKGDSSSDEKQRL